MYYPRMGFISYCDFPINNIEFLPCYSWLPKGCCFVLFLGVVPTKYLKIESWVFAASIFMVVHIWTPRTLIIPNLCFPFAESAFCWWKSTSLAVELLPPLQALRGTPKPSQTATANPNPRCLESCYLVAVGFSLWLEGVCFAFNYSIM